jgi:hypothetical protein
MFAYEFLQFEHTVVNNLIIQLLINIHIDLFKLLLCFIYAPAAVSSNDTHYTFHIFDFSLIMAQRKG